MQFLFRDSRHAVPAPALLTVLTLFFGLPKEDADHRTGTTGLDGTLSGFAAVDVPRQVMEQHRVDFRVYLQGQNLQRIMRCVLDKFGESIAVTRVVVGEGLLAVCPDLCRDFWAFYEALPTLLLKVPRWLNPAVWAARDKMHQNLIYWRRWCKAQTESETDGDGGDDAVFDPVWGTHMTKWLVRVYENLGLSEKGLLLPCSATSPCIIFAKTIPSTLWTALHILQSANLKHRVIIEMESAFEPGTFHLRSLSDLCAGHCSTQKPGYLLAGKWKIQPRAPILSVSWLAGRDDDKRAALVSSGLDGHFYPFGGGSYRCPGETFAPRLNMGTNALLLRMLGIELGDLVGAREVPSLYDRYPLGDHRFDRPVPIRARRKFMS
ncbi:hypothetical protein C8A03DRAFT_34466 [Achaetomium macrosporum]|uniref:Cytochrome P450 n=1 Tax=Achaetomium macrosporum TaxID=79813 RepID=A0AAN7C8U6_9PEZI|nr:hypothetical protein C8A03DRAFT_34466 [Achaetomium macrosporum]